MPDQAIDMSLLDLLACPRDGGTLTCVESRLECPNGHHYPVVDGIPVMLLPEAHQTIGLAEETLREVAERSAVSGDEGSAQGVVTQHVQEWIGATNGRLYRSLIGKLQEYPIPELRLPPGEGRRLLDVGCNWGRWTVSAGRRGYRAVGMDVSLRAVLAARQVATDLDVPAVFVVGDARYLPFRDGCFDVVFSYSVLQHFSKADASVAVSSIGRVLGCGGISLIQMPNRWGVRCLYHQARRGFRAPQQFEVRYWDPAELLQTFAAGIGASELSVDGFMGLGIQPSDARFLPWRYRTVIYLSELLRWLSVRLPVLARVADSLYVTSRKPGAAT